MEPIEIFRPGTHTPMNGAPITFRDEDVRAAAELYDPGANPAPIVIGHPNTDDPAFGWVSRLKFQDGVLKAELKEVEPAFANLVKSGRYKRVSAAFFPPDATANPTPGTWHLRHVGFLGARAPAVPGLKPVNFGDGGDQVVTFGDFGDDINASLWRRFRDWVIEQFDLETADKVVPAFEVDMLRDHARRSDEPETVSENGFAEGDSDGTNDDNLTTEGVQDVDKAELDARAAKLKEREEAAAEAEAAFAERQAAARRAEDEAFLGKLVKEARFPVGCKAAVVEFMARLDADDTVAFAEGQTMTQHAFMRDFLSKLPPMFAFGEYAPPSVDQAQAVNFAAPAGASVDQDRLADLGKAQAYMAQHPKVSFADACRAVGVV